MRELSTLDKAAILIKAATGERYGDGYVVTDIVVGYAEPGYRKWNEPEQVIVFGDWNNKRYPKEGDPPLTKSESIGSRLANALEKIGVECEWLDEWTRCGNCYRAMRIEADSYSWTMYGAFFEAEYICADCILKDFESYLEDYINDTNRAITFAKSGDLEQIGFVKWEPHNPHTYESGWYQGQDDDPKKIIKEIHKWKPDAQVVFLIDGVGQFDMRFSAYIRVPKLEWCCDACGKWNAKDTDCECGTNQESWLPIEPEWRTIDEAE